MELDFVKDYFVIFYLSEIQELESLLYETLFTFIVTVAMGGYKDYTFDILKWKSICTSIF